MLFENLDSVPYPTHVIYDFMILQKYRRNGIGQCAAKKAFELYNADWKLAQMANNAPAISFWRKVFHGFTSNSYKEIYREDLNKLFQLFSTKKVEVT